MRISGVFAPLVAACALAGAPGPAAAAPPPLPSPATDFAARPPQDELIYFLLPDRFANGDPANDHGGPALGPLRDGFDPTRTGFYQGGDLKGVLDHLDYIRDLGATALWIAPVFRNKWVQGPPGHESAGYHGYWITDFADVDPHFGTRADFKRLVDAAHARGMKVILDIVINHTADVIRYRECRQAPCPYRSEGEYPFTRRGGPGGAPINAGFSGDDEAHLSPENFARLTRPDFAYTPYVPPGEAHAKRPDWLNNPIYYHNRGDFAGSGAPDMITHGDFFGLDDVATENPRVVDGFIGIYARWIADFGIDGYRIDTARHVNPGFWRRFIPAMLQVARAHGRPNFHIFGEVYDPDAGVLARHTRVDGWPAVLDFGFQAAAQAVIGGREGPARLAHAFLSDPDFAPEPGGAAQLPTFLDNHDMGRFAWLLHHDHPGMGRDELLKRVALGHALLLFSRGAPVIYSGDEQGLMGTGGDQASRQPLFPSRTPSYQAETPLGAAHAGAPGWNEDAPLFRAIAGMAAVRNAHPGLRRGVQEVRLADEKPGLYVWTRTDPHDGQYVIALNTSLQPRDAGVTVDASATRWTALHGACAPASAAPGAYRVDVPALGWIVCRAAGLGGRRVTMGDWRAGAAIYQIYPRSFADADGDGVGDLRGITEKLDHVASLGVDAVWLSPVFTSPMADFGYDISDPLGIDPIFGTLEDFDALVARAHALGLKLIVDQVYCHLSDRSAWFAESRSSRTNLKADWFVWADAKPDGSPPSNWQSVFHGPAWTWDARRGQYYMHNFLPEQPQLNVHHPEVQDALLSVARFWLDRGVDGFRLDALNFLEHDPALRDNPPAPPGPRTRPFDFQRHLHNQSHPDIPRFIERLQAVVAERPGRFTVAEIGGERALEEMRDYTRGPARLDTAYAFTFLYADRLTPALVRETLLDWTPQASPGGWPSWAFSNHDAPRALSRWWPDRPTAETAPLTLLLLAVLRGNIFVYQGEELGLPQAEVPFARLVDPEAIKNWPKTLGRDGARTPLPWRAAAPHAGFSAAEPWLPVDPRHLPLAVDAQEADPDSTLHFARRVLRFRRDSAALRTGALTLLPPAGEVLAFRRGDGPDALLCAFNLGEASAPFVAPEGHWRTALATPGIEADAAPPATLPPLGGLVARRA